MNDHTNQPAEIIPALDEISEIIADAYNATDESLNYSYILPMATDELTDALGTAKEALETAYNLVEELRKARHIDER